MANDIRVAGTMVAYGNKSSTSSDSNTGATPETAKATAVGFLSVLMNYVPAVANDPASGVISGVYKENIAVSGGRDRQRTIHTDGYTKFIGTGSRQLSIAQGIVIINGGIFQDFLTFGITTSLGTSLTINDAVIENCVLGSVRVLNLNRCRLINCTTREGAIINLDRCQIVEGSIIKATSAFSCDVRGEDGSRLVQLTADATGANYSHNNIRAAAIKLPADVDYVTLAQFKVANPGNQPDSFSTDPLYINPNAGVYLVAKNSANIGTGKDGSSVGNVRPGSGSVAEMSEDTNPFSFSNPNVHQVGMVAVGAGITIDPASTSALGYRVSDWILINGGQLGRINTYIPVQNIEANKSFAGGDIENMNVPDYGFIFDGPNEAKYIPDRLTYGLQTSNSFNKPDNILVDNPKADNNSLWAVGTWKPFEYFKSALVWVNPANPLDTKSSGEIGFPWQDTANSFPPSARWARTYEVFSSARTNNY